MGASYTILVDPLVEIEDASGEGERMICWLQAREIVGPAETDPHPRPGPLPKAIYRPAGGYLAAAEPDEYLLELDDNYLEVVAERTIFHAGDNGIGIYCTGCGEEQTRLGDGWDEAFQTWWEGSPRPLTCVSCGHSAHLSGWRFDPVFGFGNLGFSFHGWSLRPQFIREFERELGRPVTVVHRHP